MRAIAKTTVWNERGDIRKAFVQSGVSEQTKFAHPGRIHEQRAAREAEQLSVCRGVAAAIVTLAYGARVHQHAPRQRIEQRGFAGAGTTQQRSCSPWREPKL